jgi:hypothetical protein
VIAKQMTIPITKPLCEKNKIKQSALCCIYCGNHYKKKISLDKHLILCEITHSKTVKKRETNDDEYKDNDVDDLYDNISTKNLCKIVMQLAMKCNRLENKVADLSKYVTKKIQKIDILDYLNNMTKTTNQPILLFDNIITTVIVEDSDIEFLFYNSFMETMNLILSKNIYKQLENELSLPVRAYTQKNYIIYVYTNQSNQTNPTWTIVTKDKFVRFLNNIQLKISKALSEWRKKNIEMLNESDSKSILYDKTFSKIMDPDFKLEKTYIKFYNNIYNKLKIPIPVSAE